MSSTELTTHTGVENVPTGLQKQQNSSLVFTSELTFNVAIINHLSPFWLLLEGICYMCLWADEKKGGERAKKSNN